MNNWDCLQLLYIRISIVSKMMSIWHYDNSSFKSLKIWFFCLFRMTLWDWCSEMTFRMFLKTKHKIDERSSANMVSYCRIKFCRRYWNKVDCWTIEILNDSSSSPLRFPKIQRTSSWVLISCFKMEVCCSICSWVGCYYIDFIVW